MDFCLRFPHVWTPPEQIKDEIVDATNSFNVTKEGEEQEKEEEARAARHLVIHQRSGQSSPSREVQDILCENEAIGGLGTEVIITEEDDFYEATEIDTEKDKKKRKSKSGKSKVFKVSTRGSRRFSKGTNSFL